MMSEQDGSVGELGFEEAMARVERIIERVESGEAGLEESIKEYEVGAGLLRRCREILARAELRVGKLDLDSLESGSSEGVSSEGGSTGGGSSADEGGS